MRVCLTLYILGPWIRCKFESSIIRTSMTWWIIRKIFDRKVTSGKSPKKGYAINAFYGKTLLRIAYLEVVHWFIFDVYGSSEVRNLQVGGTSLFFNFCVGTNWKIWRLPMNLHLCKRFSKFLGRLVPTRPLFWLRYWFTGSNLV